MLNQRLLILLVIVSFLFACSHTNRIENGDTKDRKITQLLSAADFLSWVNDETNGMKVKKTIGDITYTCLYKPIAYEALLRLSDEKITDTLLNKEMDDIKGLQYLTLRITNIKGGKELLKESLQSNDEYYRRIEYCSFKMQDDIKLIDGNDTLDCKLFHFERVFDLAPEAVFVLAFASNKSQTEEDVNNKILSFDDKLFGNGKINIGIDKASLNNIPSVITRN